MSQDLDVKCAPIRSLEELYMWKCGNRKNTVLKVTSSKCFAPRSNDGKFSLQNFKNIPKTIVCHDMKGGYLDDCYINGCTNNEAYLFTQWSLIDTFVYFSHHFITIPPPCWVHSAHLHGVTILGTIITEWDEGSRICDQIFFSKESVDYFVSYLAAVTVHYDIDGWLINIENSIVKSMVKNILYFLKSLKIVLDTMGKKSTIIWYDSVTREGKLDWQNELNILNRDFFDACDGIFLNYTWTYEHLARTVLAAGERKKDVYVGVDVFGRNCFGGGGFNTASALSVARELQLSVAIFAPGWVYETHPLQDFHSMNEKFWSLLLPHLMLRGTASLPILTSFCTGLGKGEYFKGKLISNTPWYNISKQQQQPLLAGLLYGLPNDDVNLNVVLESLKWGSSLKFGLQNICYDDAFNGGGCLLIESSECAIFPLMICEISATKDMVFALAYKGDTEHTLSLNLVFEESRTLEISHSSCSLHPIKMDEDKKTEEPTRSPKAPKLFPSTSFEDLNLKTDFEPVVTSSDGWETRLFRMANDVNEKEKWTLRAINLTSNRKVSCKIGFLGLF